jgi:16S rRNA (cytidine1402-2'-O)-methyltransferase
MKKKKHTSYKSSNFNSLAQNLNTEMKGELFVISIPIGNLNDITFRAKEIFNKNYEVYCENPLSTMRLFNALEFNNKVFKFIDDLKVLDQMIDKLSSGTSLIYVSGAGMPSLSDPGQVLTKRCLQENIKVTPICGATSLVFLSVCGLKVSKFSFLGFLKINKLFKLDMFNFVESVFFLENPRRLKKTLEKLKRDFIPNEEFQISIGQELTKMNERIIYSNLNDLDLESINYFGEFIIGIERLRKIESD